MSWLVRPRRRVPSPEIIGPKTSDNPMFPKSPPGLSAFRRAVLITTGGILALILVMFLVYGPWMRITVLKVEGTEQIDAVSLQQVTEEYLDQQRWLVIPNRNLWLLSRSHLERHIRQLIEQRISIDSFKIVKKYPHTLTVYVQERIPLLVWQSGSLQAKVDRRGTAIEFSDAPSSTLPVVIDENQTAIAVGMTVTNPGVVNAVTALWTALQVTQLPVRHFIIPTAVCPPVPVPTNVNQNTNTSLDPLDQRPASNINLNSSTGLTNVPTCDLAKLRQNAPEVHVQLADGPRILFDRRQDLVQAVGIVQRVLQAPENRQAQYIDVRFGERVYIR